MGLHVAVLDHTMGNLRSVAKALEAAGARATVTSDPREIARSDALCVPGQGIFGRCMAALAAGPLADVVREWVEGGRRYLGICLGMQVLFEGSDESPEKGLAILSGHCIRLRGDVTVPHIGWNVVSPARRDRPETYYYFDHSYAPRPDDEAIVDGWCEHGVRFAASVRTDTVLAVQFHPEKSGAAGLELLKGWVE